MIRYLLTKLSISQLKKIRNIVNLALSKKLQYYNYENIYTNNYKGLRIEVTSELEGSYISTWKIYKGDELVKAEEDDFYYSVGEAEKVAINYIDNLINEN